MNVTCTFSPKKLHEIAELEEIVRGQYTKEKVVAEEIKEEAVTNTEDTVKETVNGTSGIKISKEELGTETEINVGQVIEPDDLPLPRYRQQKIPFPMGRLLHCNHHHRSLHHSNLCQSNHP